MVLIQADTILQWTLVLSQRPNFLLLPLRPVPFQMTASDTAASFSKLESTLVWNVPMFVAFGFSTVYLSENKENGSNDHGQQPVISHQGFCLCAFMHISENDSFSSAIYTTVIISIVMRGCCVFAVIYHLQQYSTVQYFFLWQDVCDNCDHSWYFCCVCSRIAGLKFGILMVKTGFC